MVPLVSIPESLQVPLPPFVMASMRSRFLGCCRPQAFFLSYCSILPRSPFLRNTGNARTIYPGSPILAPYVVYRSHEGVGRFQVLPVTEQGQRLGIRCSSPGNGTAQRGRGGRHDTNGVPKWGCFHHDVRLGELSHQRWIRQLGPRRLTRRHRDVTQKCQLLTTGIRQTP
jgi:hypothetical protein